MPYVGDYDSYDDELDDSSEEVDEENVEIDNEMSVEEFDENESRMKKYKPLKNLRRLK